MGFQVTVAAIACHGRAVSELIAVGYRSLDMSPLGFDRI